VALKETVEAMERPGDLLRDGYVRDLIGRLGALPVERREELGAVVAARLAAAAQAIQEQGRTDGEAMLEAIAALGPPRQTAATLLTDHPPTWWATQRRRRAALLTACLGLPLLLFALLATRDALGAGSTSHALDLAVAYSCARAGASCPPRTGRPWAAATLTQVEDLMIGRLAVVLVHNLPGSRRCTQVAVVRPPGGAIWTVRDSTVTPC